MRSHTILLLLAFLLLAPAASAASHTHAKHNMLLFGEEEIFASHLVYREPHNYQVILALSLDRESREAYLRARAAQPGARMIYLLDHLDIGRIGELPSISGRVFLSDSEGREREVLPSLVLSKDRFRVLYLNELPLSLGRGAETRASPGERGE